MAEIYWRSETVDEKQGDEMARELGAEASALRLSVDEFSALEERIVRTVNLVKRERQERAAAEELVREAEAKLREQAPVTEKLEREVKALHDERDQVRLRVEKLLAQLDALEL